MTDTRCPLCRRDGSKVRDADGAIVPHLRPSAPLKRDGTGCAWVWCGRVPKPRAARSSCAPAGGGGGAA